MPLSPEDDVGGLHPLFRTSLWFVHCSLLYTSPRVGESTRFSCPLLLVSGHPSLLQFLPLKVVLTWPVLYRSPGQLPDSAGCLRGSGIAAVDTHTSSSVLHGAKLLFSGAGSHGAPAQHWWGARSPRFPVSSIVRLQVLLIWRM